VNTIENFKQGFIKSLFVTLELSKVMVPAFMAVTFIKYTVFFDFLAASAQPVMSLVGLPGETAIPITIGFFFNQYAAIGALSAMHLSVKELTVVALMLGICHELIVESAVAKKVSINLWAFILSRMAFAFITALLVNSIWELFF